MSHFSVMVFGDDVEHELAPFHEYECTGLDDEFVVDVDVHDEVKERWENETLYTIIKRPDGSKFYPFTREGNWVDEVLPFVKDRTELSLPVGWEKVKGEMAKDWLSLKHFGQNWNGSRMNSEGRLVKYTNPNSKWDW